MDSTCSESGLSGRAKGMGDRNDLTRRGGRVVVDDEDGRASRSGGRKIFGRGVGKDEKASAILRSREKERRRGSRGMNAEGGKATGARREAE